MRIRFFFAVALLLFLGITAESQSVYQMRYKQPASADTTAYNAICILYNDGTGLIRVKYISPVNADTIKVQMDIQMQFPDITIENPDRDKIYYKLVNPQILNGTDSSSVDPPVICFQKDSLTDLFEPRGLVAAAEFADTGLSAYEFMDTCCKDTAPTVSSKRIYPFLKIEFLDSVSLTENLVLGYFERNEKFYRNIFKPLKQRGFVSDPNMKLILITVANIKDLVIGDACAKDMDRIVETFKNLAGFLNIKFEPTTFSGDNYSKKNVTNALKELSPGANDIVVFYYSGHGFRKASNTSRFPFIDLREKPKDDYLANSLNMESDIFMPIKAKGARFNLVISDCCNTKVGVPNAESDPIPKTRGFGIKWNTDNCKTLFMNQSPMSILATAADVDQRATSNNKFGGFFSYFFKESIENHFSYAKTKVSWDQVLELTKANTINKADHTYCDKPYTPENICIQSPYTLIRNGRF